MTYLRVVGTDGNRRPADPLWHAAYQPPPIETSIKNIRKSIFNEIINFLRFSSHQELKIPLVRTIRLLGEQQQKLNIFKLNKELIMSVSKNPFTIKNSVRISNPIPIYRFCTINPIFRSKLYQSITQLIDDSYEIQYPRLA